MEHAKGAEAPSSGMCGRRQCTTGCGDYSLRREELLSELLRERREERKMEPKSAE